MMPPPTLMHQRISGNIDRLLTAQLGKTKPEWRSDREIGLLLPEDDKYNPEPDVTVIDTDIGIGQIYATQFFFVAEVLSGSDKPIVLDLKLAYYKQHAPCRGVLFVRQDRVEAELHVRKSVWTTSELKNPVDHIVIPDIGDIGSLSQLYRHTPLWRPEFGS